MADKNGEKEKRGGFDVIEESIHLVRTAGSRALLLYYLGSFPFVAGLIYFWGDMSKSAFAHTMIYSGSLVMCVLFIWMKTWQSVYCRELLARIRGEDAPLPTAGRFMSMALAQAAAQPSGLFILPLSFLALLPLPYAYAAYQDITVQGDGRLGSTIKRAMEQARLAPRQNITIMWALSPLMPIAVLVFFLVIVPVMKAVSPDWSFAILMIYSVLMVMALMPLSPFGVVVAVNIAMAIILIPSLMQSLLGISTPFSENPGGMLTSTFFAVIGGMTYLCLDPLVKACYTVRHFHGRSLSTGEDLKVELSRIKSRAAKAAVLLAILAVAALPGGVKAQDTPETPAAPEVERPAGFDMGELDRALDSELKDRQYAWRLPRDAAEREGGAVAAFIRSIQDTLKEWLRSFLNWLRGILKWIEDLFPDVKYNPDKGDVFASIGSVLQVFLYVLLAVILSVGAVLIYRTIRRGGLWDKQVEARAIEAEPDLEDEATTADELPEEGWRAMALELMEKGEYRLALRAAFLATISTLAERELVTVARYKSNRDYRLELDLRAHAAPEASGLFTQSARVYDAVWYGMYKAERADLDLVLQNQERIKAA